MNQVGFFLFALLLGLAIGGLQLAQPCDDEVCQLPNCRCTSTDIPGGLRARDTPQFVTVTFDDSVNNNNIQIYRNILYNRRNNNNCSIGATFYVNHENTNYQFVNELYNNGFEIALHSISHQSPLSYWAEATYEDMVREFAGQKVQMAHFANIPYDVLKGLRLPFLQMSGNNSYHMMKDYDIVYDSNWPTVDYTDPPLWPYTLDYASTQDCPISPCPTASISGIWVQPMVSWIDLSGLPCAMVDACTDFPNRLDEDAWYNFILTNFERHYLSNRAPFGFYTHAWYLTSFPTVRRALMRFLDLIANSEDIFLVNANEVVDWVKNPIPIDVYKSHPCHSFTPTTCSVSTCSLLGEHDNRQYQVTFCNVCPRVYPWLGNPLGQ